MVKSLKEKQCDKYGAWWRASLAESSATNFTNKTGIRDFADTVVRSNAEIALLGTISLKGLVVRAVSIFVVVESRKVL